MIETKLFEQLKEYLTKEFMSLSRQKDELLGEKVRLEVEKNREGQQLFENKDIIRIKKLFSPLADEIFDDERSDFQKDDKITQKLQIIQNNLIDMDISMEEIKQYLCFVQLLEKESQEEKNCHTEESQSQNKNEEVTPKADNVQENSIQENDVQENEHTKENEELNKISENIQKTLEDTIAFLQEKYPDKEILIDLEDMDFMIDWKTNWYFVNVLTYTVSASIEVTGADTIIIEGIRKENVMSINLQMLLENEKVDQFSFQYDVTLKL